MKARITTLLGVALVGLATHQAHASVVVSNLDPANPDFAVNAPQIGQATLIGTRAISLTSVQFLQDGGFTAGETFAVYGRNTDGTLGSSLFTGFTLANDPTSSVTTATVSTGFTLQASTGYYFVLTTPTTANVEWSYTSTTDYASAFGATLPATGNDSFFRTTIAGAPVYRTLASGPQEFQVNGSPAAVPEPSTWAVIGFAMAAGVVLRARRSIAA